MNNVNKNEFIAKVIRVDGEFRLIIPNEILRRLNLKENDKITVDVFKINSSVVK